MENIEITNEYDIKILNLIFKKLFDNQIDYSTKQINEILNSEFSFFKRKRIMIVQNGDNRELQAVKRDNPES